MDITHFSSYEELRDKFELSIPAEYNIAADTVDRHAWDKGKLAIFYEDESGHQEKYTFWELKILSNQFANLLHSLGVEKGDRLGINLPQRPETAIAHMAIYKLGGIAVPLSILYGPDTLEQILRDSGARVIVVDEKYKMNINKIRDKVKALQHVIVVGGEDEGEINFWSAVTKAPRYFDVARTKAEDAALILFTGGTTGLPKGVLFPQRIILGFLPPLQTFYNLLFDEETVLWTPSDWVWAGLMVVLYPALWFGRPVLAYNGRFNPEKAFELMEKYGVTNTFLVPTAIKRMMKLDSPGNKYDLSLKVIASAAEAVPSKLLEWAKKELEVPVNEFYGLSEAGHLVGNCSRLWKGKPGSMGKSYPWREVAIIDEQGNQLPPGQVGQIATKVWQPQIFLGYWGKPEETKKLFLGDWVLTGDLAERDGDEYYFFRGRVDDQIKSAGYRIGPAEIEEGMLKHPAVAEAAAVAIPDDARGHIVKAFIKLKQGFEPTEQLKKDIQVLVKNDLAAYKYPRQIEFIEKLPTTIHGKIDRKELRRREEERKKKK